MNFDKVIEVQNCFSEVEKYIKVKSSLSMNNDEKNILIALHYDSFKIIEADRINILGKIQKLNKSFEINHVVINNHMVLFQGTVKGND